MRTDFFILLMAIILVPVYLKGQPYEHAGGVRAGYSSGISYKGFFLHRMTAIEIDGLYNQHGLNISANYLWHMEPFRSSRWLIYMGGGVFGGTWDPVPLDPEDQQNKLSLGMCALGGIEYIVRGLPLNFGVDWRPMLNVYSTFAYEFIDFGITIRYRFKL